MKNKLWTLLLVIAMVALIGMRFTAAPAQVKVADTLFIDDVMTVRMGNRYGIINKDGEYIDPMTLSKLFFA